MVLLAAFDAFLHRLTRQEDLVLGSPIANRNQVGIEGLVGLFVNTLVLRTDLGGNPSFRTLLGRVRETTLGAYAHQDLPFEKLVEELAPERSLSHAPLFQVLLALQNAPTAAAELPGLTLEPLEGEGGTAKFDLSLELFEDGLGLSGGIEYSTDLFDGATAARWANHLERLLEEVVADPDVRLSSLDLLSLAERHQILGEWNDTRAGFPETTQLHQFFEAVVERSPEAVAAVCAGRELTYGELEARSNRLAHLLREVGIERGAAVGVWVERSFDLLTAVLGILKAGGITLPWTTPGRPAGWSRSSPRPAPSRSWPAAVCCRRWRRCAGGCRRCRTWSVPASRKRRRRWNPSIRRACGSCGLRGGAGGGPGDGGWVRQCLHRAAFQRGGSGRVPGPGALAGRPLAAAGCAGAGDRQRLRAPAVGAGLAGGPRHRRRSLSLDPGAQPRAGEGRGIWPWR